MKIIQSLLQSIVLIATLPTLIVSDFIEIEEWDVSKYSYTVNGTTYTEARAYAGEDVIFTYTPGLHSVVEFDNEEDFENCAVVNATVLDESGNYTMELWPFKDVKGPHFLACGIAGHCESGQKIKIVVKPKQYEGSTKNTCVVSEGTTATEVTGNPAKSVGKCAKKCKNTQDCLGFQWTKNRERVEGSKKKVWVKTCTLYDDYPDYTGVKETKKAVCKSVKYNNTVEED
jgi:hypothetical protein